MIPDLRFSATFLKFKLYLKKAIGLGNPPEVWSSLWYRCVWWWFGLDTVPESLSVAIPELSSFLSSSPSPSASSSSSGSRMASLSSMTRGSVGVFSLLNVIFTILRKMKILKKVMVVDSCLSAAFCLCNLHPEADTNSQPQPSIDFDSAFNHWSWSCSVSAQPVPGHYTPSTIKQNILRRRIGKEGRPQGTEFGIYIIMERPVMQCWLCYVLLCRACEAATMKTANMPELTSPVTSRVRWLVAVRASNEGSQTFVNHGEGPY